MRRLGFFFNTGFLVFLFGMGSSCVLPDGTSGNPADTSHFHKPSSENGSGGGSGPIEPSLKISPLTSVVQMPASTTLLGESLTLTLLGKNKAGDPVTEGGATVSFVHAGGSSAGTFSPTIDNGDGTYETTFTATATGTATGVTATLNGLPLFTPPQPIEVKLGTYKRTLTLSTPTNQGEYPIRVELNPGNFDYANADSKGKDLRFLDSNGNTLSSWIEHFDPAGTSVAWVQIPDAGTTELELVYGNAHLSSGNDKEGTFSYSAAQTLYVELSSFGGAGGQVTSIASYTNANSVTVQDASGSSNQILSQYSFFTFASLIQGTIQSTGPLSGRGLSYQKAFDAFVPLVFASRVLGFPKSRSGDDRWDFYNPGSTPANVTVRNFNAAGTEVGNQGLSVNGGSFASLSFDVALYGLVDSDAPILGFYSDGGVKDATVLAPPGTDLFGVNSKAGNIGFTQDGTSGLVYYSNGVSSSISGDKGDVMALAPGGSEGNALGVRIVTDKPIVTASQADSDGSESMSFYPREELDNEYLIPANAQYIAVVCPYAATVTVYNPDQSVNQSQACSPSGNHPGFLHLGNTTDTVEFLPGSRVAADTIFFAYFEYDGQDETNLIGPKHGRPYSANPPTVSVGVEMGL